MANQYKNKVVFNGDTLIDLSEDTVTSASHILKGYVGHLADGKKVTGTAESGGGNNYTRTVIVPEQTVTASGNEWALVTSTVNIIEGDEYIVTVNGVEKISTATKNGSINYISFIDWDWSSSGYAFGTEPPYSGVYFRAITDGTYTVKVEKLELTGSGGEGGSSTLITKTITANGTYSASDDSADGYSSVTVNVPSSGDSGINVQAYIGMDYTTATSYTATEVTLTIAKTGTYNVSWMGFRNTNSGTSGSQLYINGSAYGSAQTTFTSTYGQSVEMKGISLNEGDVLVVRARARNTSYRMYVGNLIIEQTA